jgi:hypothetical protein
MYDSFGVRRASGDHAAALNMIINSLGHDHIRLKAPGLRLREILGHKPAEVTIGALIGIMLGLLFNIDKLEKQLDWLRVRPEAIEFYVYGAIFAALAIGGLAFRLIVRFRYRKSRPMVRLAKHILIKTQLIGWLGLLFSLAQLQRLNYYSWRAWPILLLVALLTWDSWLLKRFYRQLPADLALDMPSASLGWNRRRSERNANKKPLWSCNQKGGDCPPLICTAGIPSQGSLIACPCQPVGGRPIGVDGHDTDQVLPNHPAQRTR